MPPILEQAYLWYSKDIARAERQNYIFQHAHGIVEAQRDIWRRMYAHARLYDPFCRVVDPDALPDGIGGPSTWEQIPVYDNLIESVVETLKSMISINRPMARFMTDGGDWSLQRQSELLAQGMEGESRRTNLHHELARGMVDAMVFGDGFVFDQIKNGKLRYKRALPDQVLVDEIEAREDDPMQMHRQRVVDKASLSEIFNKPAQREAIRISTDKSRLWAYRQIPSHKCVLMESWHLKTTDDSDDGLYVCSVEGGVLEEEPYDDHEFPMTRIVWQERQAGYYNKGIVETLAGRQMMLNRTNGVISKSLRMMANPKWLVSYADAALKIRMNTGIGECVPYKGEKPEVMAGPIVPPELYQYRAQLKQEGYPDSGVSEMRAHGTKEPGIEAGIAIREMRDISSDRFSMQLVGYEDSYKHAIERGVKRNCEIYAERGEHAVMWKGKNFLKRIDWKVFKDLDMNQYEVTIEASSLSSKSPAARKQDIYDFLQLGLIGRDEARKLFAHPDLQAVQDWLSSAIEDAMATCEAIENGKVDDVPPEPTQDLSVVARIVQARYNNCRHRGAPPSIRQAYRDWMTSAKDLVDEAKKATMDEQMQQANAMGAAQQAMMPVNPPQIPLGPPGAGVPQPQPPPGVS